MDYPLTEEQQKIVNCTKSLQIVVAGPGTGKTDCIRYVIKKHPNRKYLILSLTNTIVSKLRKDLDDLNRQNIIVATVHSIASSIVRKTPEESNLGHDFVIENEVERELVLNDINLLYRKEEKPVSLYELEQFYAKLSDAREEINFVAEKKDRFSTLYNSCDFYQLNYYALQVLESLGKSSLPRDIYEIDHILVDEYQDFNKVDQQLIDVLAEKLGCKLWIFGDDDQSIYSFRHAYPSGLCEKYEAAKLNDDAETNYLSRCFRTKNKHLVDAAYSISEKLNHDSRIPKKYYSEEQVGPNINLIEGAMFHSERNIHCEAEFIALTIKNLLEKNILILGRESYLLSPIMKQLDKLGISYEKPKFKFTPNLHIFNSVCRLVKKDDESAFRVLIENSSGISERKKEDLIRGFIEKKSYFTLGDPLAIKLKEWVKNLRLVFEKDGQKITKNVIDMISKQNNLSFNSQERKIIEDLIEEKVDVSLGLTEELAEIVDDIENGSHKTNVRVMTLHSSKGESGDIVFITGFEEWVMPRYDRDSEENRRLFYVAFTRAKEMVYLSYTKMRFDRYKKPGPYNSKTPSMYLNFLPGNMIDKKEIKTFDIKKMKAILDRTNQRRPQS